MVKIKYNKKSSNLLLMTRSVVDIFWLFELILKSLKNYMASQISLSSSSAFPFVFAFLNSSTSTFILCYVLLCLVMVLILTTDDRWPTKSKKDITDRT